ncbi:DUF1028 domain-containing protein [Noviherbaspirillum saxi]|uniref:DUF1028 domain-containing protein n=1 Tax=Noviherbaspirillum saxi TaxID=2320863 RepID=A0A3A3FEP2_9BURK|nr:DUF1028 domain-containing protein [Noviherbaspirillum saxi]RJF91806.1 DUF1028 domain-containing protein [Noviherbaspirillum saxi]
MTFSLTAYCPETRMVGVAITTSSICVGSRCPWVRAGAGAVATQNVTLPSLGPDILDRLEAGMGPADALADALRGREFNGYRQVVVVDTQGRSAHFTGTEILGTNAVATGDGCIAAGNLLSTVEVPQAMAGAFAAAKGEHLAERLLRGLAAGVAAGGEVGPVHSAALLVASDLAWPLVNLRVDWEDEEPVTRLRTLWDMYRPQMNDYVARALNPPAAPSYGVPGDE